MKYEIFISYRRVDTLGIAKTLYDRLKKFYGDDVVFLDTDELQGGDKWKEVLRKSGKSAKIALVLIGEEWQVKRDSGSLRIKEEGDWVRKEIREAINNKLTIIPVLVNNAQLPSESDLPADILPLLDSNTLNLRSTRFEDDYNNLNRIVCNEIRTKYKCFYLKYGKMIWSILAAVLFAGLLYWIFIPDRNPCPEYLLSEHLQVVTFGSDEKATEWDKMNIEFALKQGNAFDAETAKYKASNVNYLEFKPKASQCGVDVYLGLYENNGRGVFNFGFPNDNINQLMYTPDLEPNTISSSLSKLLGEKKFANSLDDLVCFLTSYVAKTNRPYRKAFLKNCSIADKDLRIISNNLMIDVFIADEDYKAAEIKLEDQEGLRILTSNEKAKKAEVAKALGKHSDAIIIYSDLLEDPHFKKSAILEKRGDEFNKIKDYQSAKSDFESARNEDPSKQELNEKIRVIDTEIIRIDRDLDRNSNASTLTDREKLEKAEWAVQIGDVDRAAILTNSIAPSLINNEKLKSLQQEIKIIQGVDIDISSLPENIPQRLNTRINNIQRR